MSPNIFIASVEMGSFSRRTLGGILRVLRSDVPGEVSGEVSGKGYARYVAGFVVRRFGGDREGKRGDIAGRVGKASSVNLVWYVEEIVKR
jgi:hypothetical protein